MSGHNLLHAAMHALGHASRHEREHGNTSKANGFGLIMLGLVLLPAGGIGLPLILWGIYLLKSK